MITADGRWLYAVLFGTQTIGAIVLFWNGVPHYRRVLADPSGHEAEVETLVWSLSSIGLMQVGYWLRFRLHPPLPELLNAVLGHVVLFLGRFAFVFASAVFSLVFLAPRPDFSMPIGRYALTLLGIFAVFCYTLELERLGRALLGPQPKPGQ
jgi:hypothetical protein